MPVKILVGLSVFVSLQLKAQIATRTDNQQFESLVSACITAKTKDKICEGMIALKQVGDDSIELIKEYANLGPYEYATLTLLNYGITGRMRIKFNALWDHDTQNILDIKRDGWVFSVQKQF